MGKKCKITVSFDRIHSSETLENDDYNHEIPAHQKVVICSYLEVHKNAKIQHHLLC